MFLPHMEVINLELSIANTLMSHDENISNEEGLVDLVASLEIQIHTLETARNNWIFEAVTAEQLNKIFLDKYSLIIPT